MRDKDAIFTLSPADGEDFQYTHRDEEYVSDDEDSQFNSNGEDEGPSTIGELSKWIYSNKIQMGQLNKEFFFSTD